MSRENYTLRQIRQSLRGEWTVVQSSSANTAQTATKAGVAGSNHYLSAFEVVISGADAGADILIEVKEDTTVKWRTYIGSGATRGERVGVVFTTSIEFAEGEDIDITAGTGGASCVTSISMVGYTEDHTP